MLQPRFGGSRLVMSWIRFGIFVLRIMVLDVCDVTCLRLSGQGALT